MVSPSSSLQQTQVPIPEERRERLVPAVPPNVGQVERAASVLLGGLLMAGGLKRWSLFGLVMGGVGAALIQRGATGRCPVYRSLGVTTVDDAGEGGVFGKAISHPLHQHIRIEKSIAIEKPVGEVYAFWRNLENLPLFMSHLEKVKQLDDMRSQWTAKLPGGKTLEWSADIVAEEPNRRLAWRSIEGADVANAGQVLFESEAGGKGTVIHVLVAYEPPAGVLGVLFAKVMGRDPAVKVEEDLQRLKEHLEEGGSIEGRKPGTHNRPA